ncbi:MAG: hypothetical protein HFH57_03525 [Lachnospiraceae bacterium]|nr:hypothetical protein [Lachnospiraceae bacterium]
MRFLDLDGTILDLWPRYYSVFCELLRAKNITLQQYKSKKLCLCRDDAVAASFGYVLPADYFIKKAELLEDREFLKLDGLYLSGTQIGMLFEGDNTMILTKRRRLDNLNWQLRKLGIDLPTVVIEDLTKKQWIQLNYPVERSEMIGDSIMDLETGQLPNVLPVMVGYGLGTRKQFDSVKIPYIYIDSPNELIDYLKTRGI